MLVELNEPRRKERLLGEIYWELRELGVFCVFAGENSFGFLNGPGNAKIRVIP